MNPAEGPQARAGLARALIAAQPEDRFGAAGLLDRVCRAASAAMAASGAGISVMTADGTRGIGGASDPNSERADDQQFVLGEGPGIEAFTSRRPVLTPDLSARLNRSWPIWAAAAHQDGIRAVFAFPLQVGAVGLGVMDVFRCRAGPLAAEQLVTALAFADVTVDALLDLHDGGGLGGGGLGGGLGDIGWHAQLFQAQGMVMVQLGASQSEALVRMRAYAFAENRRLDEVARDVVNRTLRFD